MCSKPKICDRLQVSPSKVRRPAAIDMLLSSKSNYLMSDQVLAVSGGLKLYRGPLGMTISGNTDLLKRDKFLGDSRKAIGRKVASADVLSMWELPDQQMMRDTSIILQPRKVTSHNQADALLHEPEQEDLTKENVLGDGDGTENGRVCKADLQVSAATGLPVWKQTTLSQTQHTKLDILQPSSIRHSQVILDPIYEIVNFTD